MRKGWECPKCGCINSPDVKQCPCKSHYIPYWREQKIQHIRRPDGEFIIDTDGEFVPLRYNVKS